MFSFSIKLPVLVTKDMFTPEKKKTNHFHFSWLLLPAYCLPLLLLFFRACKLNIPLSQEK